MRREAKGRRCCRRRRGHCCDKEREKKSGVEKIAIESFHFFSLRKIRLQSKSKDTSAHAAAALSANHSRQTPLILASLGCPRSVDRVLNA